MNSLQNEYGFWKIFVPKCEWFENQSWLDCSLVCDATNDIYYDTKISGLVNCSERDVINAVLMWAGFLPRTGFNWAIKAFSLANFNCHFPLHVVSELMPLWRTESSFDSDF